MAFLLVNPATGEIAAWFQAIPPKVGPEKQNLLNNGWKWVETDVAGLEDLRDFEWDEATATLKAKAWPTYHGQTVRNAAEVDDITRRRIESEVVDVAEELKEIRKALAKAGIAIASHTQIEAIIQEGRDFKAAQGWA